MIIALGCGSKTERTINPQLKEMLEDSGIDGWSRYWIGQFLYTDKDSVIHTTLNCSMYTEFPGTGHRRVICIDTANIMRFHGKYFCDVCVGDSLGRRIADIILRNEKKLMNYVDEQDDISMKDE